jgi:hypothetical protein
MEKLPALSPIIQRRAQRMMMTEQRLDRNCAPEIKTHFLTGMIGVPIGIGARHFTISDCSGTEGGDPWTGSTNIGL